MVVAILGALAAHLPAPADAGCGCSKPPPPRADVRPFVGYPDQKITIFDGKLAAGQSYDVLFESTADGSADWSRGRGILRRDLADGEMRVHLRVPVGSVGLGPCRISVWSGGSRVVDMNDDEFTVIAPPITLHEFNESISRDGYQTGVGRDGTVYIAVDVEQVSSGTTFIGQAVGFPMRFNAGDVTMYNEQGFLMQMLDPNVAGLFQIKTGDVVKSATLSYWRHEFQTYKQEHRRADARRRDDDPDWHADGSYHVDHDRIVVAVRPSMPSGGHPAPGATPPFRLLVTSSSQQLPANVLP
jgi:hypothetical protein